MKRPWFAFFPRDWDSDISLKQCSLAAQGLWMRLLCRMHESPEYGYLVKQNGEPWTTRDLARSIGIDKRRVEHLLKILRDAGVFTVDQREIICSRRMVNDGKKAAAWRQAKQNHRKRQKCQVDVSEMSDPMSSECPAVPIPTISLDKLSIPIVGSSSMGGCGGEGSAAAPKTRRASARSRATRLPEDFLLSEELRGYALEHGLPVGEVESQFEHFQNFHTAKGSTFMDWPAAWRTWVGNYKQFQKGGRNGETADERRNRETAEKIKRMAQRLQGEGF